MIKYNERGEIEEKQTINSVLWGFDEDCWGFFADERFAFCDVLKYTFLGVISFLFVSFSPVLICVYVNVTGVM